MVNWLYKILNGNKTIYESINNCEVISFDIFDTLINRKCKKPELIFELVEKRYNSIFDQKVLDFKLRRIEAEHYARKISINKEISFNEISSALLKYYRPEIVRSFAELEVQVEIEQCIARDEIVQIYNSLIGKKKLVITSDMYLPVNVIQSILSNNNILTPDRIFLSSEANATKADGSLYKLLLSQMKCSSNDVLHIGDNFKSDFLRPKSLGINSFLINKA